ncbi:Fic/DOC family protein [Kribbella sp. VKM Ac-2527]|uniref:Fic/DOC family protein n=1 Tax=Kribbella caucasensis TaxID=2512215 RepID=A0A4R6JHW2_9ACTN|nr:Fic family protein [Kribbella sp. VKM Ac-2527]TDO35609.1 Fic/DOC family protein [Kribbella sp. VKM Ac-2527]
MNVAQNAPHPAGRLEFATATNRASLSRFHRSGRAIRLASGLYAIDATLPPEKVAHHHRFAVAAHTWPAAVICDRSALSGGEPVDGWLFLCHPEPPRTSDLSLPGLTLSARIGPGPLPGDMPMPDGLHLSGPARGLVENAVTRGRPREGKPARYAGLRAVEDRMDEEARIGGAGRISRLLAQLDVISGHFGKRQVEDVRSRLAALLGTSANTRLTSTRLAARLAGEPYDEHRLQLLERLTRYLQTIPPVPRPAVGGESRWEWLPFFESYFSNFIEGTQFGVEEARRIAIDGEVPTTRPQDAHDVAATYRIASDPVLSKTIPASGDQLLELLVERHTTLMAARDDKRPGQFKVAQNYAGGYAFVAPEMVQGTLARGFEAIVPLTDPLQRAVAVMLLLTEVHPFDDGNGRIARLFTNAELAAAGQVRIIIPTVYRNNYLAGLVGVSNGAGDGQTLYSVLDFAQRWTAMIDWSSYERADADLRSTNAYLDSGVAESSGIRLRLPG